jgi:hypothetical protein
MIYGIWVTVSEGVTGSRSGWYREGGNIVAFDSMADAAAKTDWLTAEPRYNYLYFRVAEIPGARNLLT